jgi:hypothetical protein
MRERTALRQSTGHAGVMVCEPWGSVAGGVSMPAGFSGTVSDSRLAGSSGTEGETRIASARAGDGPVLWDNGSGGSLGRLAAEGRVCGKGLFRQGTCRKAGLPVVDRDHARGSEIQAGEEPSELRPGPQLHDCG